MRNSSGLRQEDHLIDAAILELLEPRANLGRRADAIGGAALGQREILGLVLVVIPQIGFARLVISEERVVPEPVQKKPVILDRELAHLVLVAIAKKRARDREVGVDIVADGFAFVLKRRVVIVHP